MSSQFTPVIDLCAWNVDLANNVNVDNKNVLRNHCHVKVRFAITFRIKLITCHSHVALSSVWMHMSIIYHLHNLERMRGSRYE